MKTVAIIAEYNPFHNGHLYQIEKIKECLGTDTAIIAIMSGNYVQRGEIAILDKWQRAKIAVECGVDLVLELPFPYSMASAEFFAKAGVKIASEVCADILAFGSESGNTDELVKIAKNMLSDAYKSKFNELSADPNYSEIGYPKLVEKAYTAIFDDELCSLFFKPNNILALEYIKAIINSKSHLIPFSIKREGADYSDEKIGDSPFQSATALRKALIKNATSASEYIPNTAFNTISTLLHEGQFPCESQRLSSAVLTHFRLSDPTLGNEIHDAGGGLYNRLKNKSFEATDISTLIEIAATKKYTTARIKRAIWYSLLGVTSSDVQKMPEYTQLLATNSVGQNLLKKLKKIDGITVITKPSSYKSLSPDAVKQKQLSDGADSVFQLSKPVGVPGNASLKSTPFVKK